MTGRPSAAIAHALRLHAQGMGVSEAAGIAGVSARHLRRVLRAAGDPPAQPGRPAAALRRRKARRA